MEKRRFLIAAGVVAWVCLGASSWCGARLRPDEIALIVNSNQGESRSIADYYCLRRNVPPAHIISLDLPDSEKISRQYYDDKVVPSLRERLNAEPLKDKIKCLVTVRGVPLVIGPRRLEGQSAQWLALIVRQMDERFGQLQQITTELNNLADPTATTAAAENQKKFWLPRARLMRSKKAARMLQEAHQAVQAATRSLGAPSTTSDLQQRRRQRFEPLDKQWRGLQAKHEQLTNQLRRTFDEKQRLSISKELQELGNYLRDAFTQVKELQQSGPDTSLMKERYDLIYEAGGLQALCTTLLNDRIALDDEESNAAFDSELSLLFWPSYPLGEWQPNLLRAYPPDVQLFNAVNPGSKTLMVSRLDGPTAAIAMGLVSKAIDAEKSPLYGSAYFDTRGIHKDQDAFGSLGSFDEYLRKTARDVRKNTALQVIVDDKQELFGPGQCPSTTLYCGWYSLRNYIPAFEFARGSVGYHMASFEAETLADDPNSNVWCKRMLEEGITATLGAVAEPYLLGLVRPDLFFSELIGGEHCLVECFYRTKPFNSWMLTLIGDPLYRPRYATKRGFRPAL